MQNGDNAISNTDGNQEIIENNTMDGVKRGLRHEFSADLSIYEKSRGGTKERANRKGNIEQSDAVSVGGKSNSNEKWGTCNKMKRGVRFGVEKEVTVENIYRSQEHQLVDLERFGDRLAAGDRVEKV